MHFGARRWVERATAFGAGAHILDVGGRNINGSVRDLFPTALSYNAIDLEDGPGVDIVCDFLHYSTVTTQAGERIGEVDLVLHLEVAEHTPDWADHLAHAAHLLRPDGRLVLTAAGPSRAPHNADGTRPHTTGHYANIHPDALERVLAQHYTAHVIRTGPHDPAGLTPGAPPDLGDVYALARR